MTQITTLVVLTGATGFIGSATLVCLLRAGYSVRALVRRQADVLSVLARPSIQHLAPGPRLSFLVVPSLLEHPEPLASAMAGATHIVHTASPRAAAGPGKSLVPPEAQVRHFYDPAVAGTLNVLAAAAAAGTTVRRVVITSSVLALAPLAELDGSSTPPSAALTPRDRAPEIPPTRAPWPSDFAAYANAKVSALLETEAWLARAVPRPAFDVVHLHPGVVLGPNDSAVAAADVVRGSNALLFGLLLGAAQGGAAVVGAAAHVSDVARAHVAALEPGVQGGRGYIVARPVVWNELVGVAQRLCPERFASGFFVTGGDVRTVPVYFDADETEAALGFKLSGLDEAVQETLGQYFAFRTG